MTIPIRLKMIPAVFQFLVLQILFATGWQLNGQLMTKEDLEREITTYQVAFQQAKTPDMTGVQAGRIWLHFGALYQDAGMYGQSEQAFEQALRLLAVAPVSTPDLAMAIDSLGTLYMETGNVKEAERAESKALKMREEAGLTSEFPRSWYHLATLYLREHQPAKATNFAERAVNALLADPGAVPEDKLGSQLVLASALCQSHQYAEAIEKLAALFRWQNKPTVPVRCQPVSAHFFSGTHSGRAAISPPPVDSCRMGQKSWARRWVGSIQAIFWS